MRLRRLKAPAFLPAAHGHCVSRVVGRQFVPGGEEKDERVEYLRTCERFGGLAVISCCIMSKEALRRWCCHLSGVPENEARQKEESPKGEMAAVCRDRIPRETALEVLAKGGNLSKADYLRGKARCFSEGADTGESEEDRLFNFRPLRAGVFG